MWERGQTGADRPACDWFQMPPEPGTAAARASGTRVRARRAQFLTRARRRPSAARRERLGPRLGAEPSRCGPAAGAARSQPRCDRGRRAGCGGDERATAAEPLGEVRVGSVAPARPVPRLGRRRRGASGWRRSTTSARRSTSGTARCENAGAHRRAGRTSVFDGACANDFAAGFRLYKLYARATGFASFRRGAPLSPALAALTRTQRSGAENALGNAVCGRRLSFDTRHPRLVGSRACRGGARARLGDTGTGAVEELVDHRPRRGPRRPCDRGRRGRRPAPRRRRRVRGHRRVRERRASSSRATRSSSAAPPVGHRRRRSSSAPRARRWSPSPSTRTSRRLQRGTVATCARPRSRRSPAARSSSRCPPTRTAGDEIADGGELTQSETVSAVDLDQLFNTLSPKTIKDFKHVIQGFELSYDGVGEQANQRLQVPEPVPLDLAAGVRRARPPTSRRSRT